MGSLPAKDGRGFPLRPLATHLSGKSAAPNICKIDAAPETTHIPSRPQSIPPPPSDRLSSAWRVNPYPTTDNPLWIVPFKTTSLS